ncbi:MAG: ISAzo13 family transposase, partial [Cytophagales bacterium]|nr:ISAzo13 family transposase [Cytophagales bacterium]
MQNDLLNTIHSKFVLLNPSMNERMRRLWASAEAQQIGWSGISLVAQATGLAHTTIRRGIKELQTPQNILDVNQVRRSGAGRKKLELQDTELIKALEALVEPMSRGQPDSPLRWTCKSTRNLADELTRNHHPVSARKVAYLLHEAGYSLQANRKTREGISHPDRNAQFEYINDQVMSFMEADEPAISVDAKKKENIGDFCNVGKEYRKKGDPEKVRTHDFKDKELGKVTPYGIYDLACNEGWVSVGIDHDTAEFACASILRWWKEMGEDHFPRAQSLLITADGGGSNSSRSRLWKKELQKLANQLDLSLTVDHFPPGTSKWNKIEHRLFSFITKNWRGQPLVSHQAVVNLISHTSTKTGLKVKAWLDRSNYEVGKKVSDEEMERIKIKRH